MEIIVCRYWLIAKWRVCGSYFHNPKGTVQKILETTYSIGYIRITIYHKCKYIEI